MPRPSRDHSRKVWDVYELDMAFKSALQRHLLPDGLIIRTDFGTYALADTASRYVSKGELIIAELAKGPMTFQMLVQETGITPQSLPRFLEVLRAKRKIIRVRRGMYALPGGARNTSPHLI